MGKRNNKHQAGVSSQAGTGDGGSESHASAKAQEKMGGDDSDHDMPPIGTEIGPDDVVEYSSKWKEFTDNALMFLYIMIPMHCLALTLVFVFSPRLWFAFALYLFFFYFDGKHKNGVGRVVPWVRRWALWRFVRDYFQARLIRTVELNPSRNYFFICFPHGVFSFAMFINILSEANNFSLLFPGISPRVLGAPAMFRLPFLRDLMLSLGVVNSSARSAEQVLERGHSAVVLPGGAAESLNSEPGTNRLILDKRKGFVRIALKHGTPLVPVFHFGETDTYNQLTHPFIRACQHTMEKLFTFTVPLAYGKWGILPRRCRITTVVGKPIYVPKIENPSVEDINEWHRIFKERLAALYNTHKNDLSRSRKESMVITQ